MLKHKIDFKQGRGKIEGKYRTTLFYKDGSKVSIPSIDLPMNDNLVVNLAGELMAAFFMGETNLLTNYGNLHFAIGTGDPAWDALPDKGKSNATPDLTQLVNEVARVEPVSKSFIDGWDGSVVIAPDISNYIRVVFEVDNTVAIDEYIREFGIFCLGTSLVNSGTLFDYVIHASFQKIVELYKIQQQFEIKF